MAGGREVAESAQKESLDLFEQCVWQHGERLKPLHFCWDQKTFLLKINFNNSFTTSSLVLQS